MTKPGLGAAGCCRPLSRAFPDSVPHNSLISLLFLKLKGLPRVIALIPPCCWRDYKEQPLTLSRVVMGSQLGQGPFLRSTPRLSKHKHGGPIPSLTLWKLAWLGGGIISRGVCVWSVMHLVGRRGCVKRGERQVKKHSSTCLAKTAMSSLKESEEQTSPPATPGSRGVQVANSHFSKTRANRGNNGCLPGSDTQRKKGGGSSGKEKRQRERRFQSTSIFSPFKNNN